MTNEIKNSILSGNGPGQNPQFINKEAVLASVDTSPKYYFLFLVLSVFSALLASWKISAFNDAPSWTLATSALLATALFIFFAVFIPWFVRSTVYGIIFAIFSSIAFAAFFANHFSIWLISGMAFFIIFFVNAFYRARRKIDTQLTIQFFQTSASFIRTTATGLALFLALLYGAIFASTATISLSAYNIFLDISAPAIRSALPGFQANLPIDDAISAIATLQLQKNDDFKAATKAEQDKVVASTISAIEAEVARVAKVDFSPEDTVLTYTHAALNSYIQRTKDKGFFPFLIIAVFSAIFGFIRLIFAVLRIVIALLALIVYYLLMSIGVMHITTENRPKEVILLK
ncbi:MAG: hypothetical protein COU10_00875 [Candidatus Harrisonbacteria bacterium CG10_big_fil_rev_8_21_14_0_10_45_28]|uniref:Uncharacterized protein n=1 Tax=Candidatus Harrisonbacteria bacterium CG10_big_fil_rev_8_21_14_0_10_45_28 TaxID=1974586 RepID=A0A2H0UP01_9BACT|nr:MAG: hypothetical protein COU10_00875 [Candidatus Harrisonbacteria bacterium CG10_big_fil_rev_8_21_14_0_10_45_28]